MSGHMYELWGRHYGDQVNVRQVYLNTNFGHINQYDSYPFGCLQNAQLFAYFSNIPAIGTQPNTSVNNYRPRQNSNGVGPQHQF